MPAFSYVAINSQGEKQKGILEAENFKHARQLLRDKTLIPLEVQFAQQKMTKQSLLTTNKKPKESLSSKELALMTRQFATLLGAGMPVEEVLAAVAEQSDTPKIKGLILSIRSKLLEGHSFAFSLSNFPRAFSHLYCATIAAGEKSGHLELILQRLADYTEQQFTLNQKLRNALIYPTIMVIVAVSIVGFLLTYVVPKMIAIYSNLHQSLPLLTQLLIMLSHGLKHYGMVTFVFLCTALFIFFRTLNNNSLFRFGVQRFLLRLPFLGNTLKMIDTARFARTFAILSSAGVSIIEAMTIASQLITHAPIRQAVETAIQRIREGANIHLALKQTAFFPPMSLHLIASGEASGQLEAMLERAASHQENSVMQLFETTLTLLEPLIILLMGTIVLFIVLAVLLPIFQLDQFTG